MKGTKTIYNDSNYTLLCNGSECMVSFHISSLTIKKWTNFINSTVLKNYTEFLPPYNAWGNCRYHLTAVLVRTDGGVEVHNQSSWDADNTYIDGSVTYPMKNPYI